MGDLEILLKVPLSHIIKMFAFALQSWKWRQPYHSRPKDISFRTMCIRHPTLYAGYLASPSPFSTWKR